MDLQDTCHESKEGFSSNKVVRVLRGVNNSVICTFVQGIKLNTSYKVNTNSSPQQFWMCTLTGYFQACQEAKESKKAHLKYHNNTGENSSLEVPLPPFTHGGLVYHRQEKNQQPLTWPVFLSVSTACLWVAPSKLIPLTESTRSPALIT